MVAKKPQFRLTVPRVPEASLHKEIAQVLRLEVAPAGRVSRAGVCWFSIDIAAYGGSTPGLRTGRGVVAGIPDVLVLYRGRAHWIEVKAVDGHPLIVSGPKVVLNRPKSLFGLISVRIVGPPIDAHLFSFRLRFPYFGPPSEPGMTGTATYSAVVGRNLLQCPPALCRMVVHGLDQVSGTPQAERAEIGRLCGDIGNYPLEPSRRRHFLDFPRFCKKRHDEK